MDDALCFACCLCFITHWGLVSTCQSERYFIIYVRSPIVKQWCPMNIVSGSEVCGVLGISVKPYHSCVQVYIGIESCNCRRHDSTGERARERERDVGQCKMWRVWSVRYCIILICQWYQFVQYYWYSFRLQADCHGVSCLLIELADRRTCFFVQNDLKASVLKPPFRSILELWQRFRNYGK